MECDYESEGFCEFEGICAYQMIDPARVEDDGKNHLLCREWCKQWIKENHGYDL